MIKFNLFSVRFSVSFWSVLLITYGIVSSVNGQKLIIICLFCALVHELGHLIMICIYCKSLPEYITINLFEFQIKSDLKLCSIKSEVIITVSGVAANLVLSLFSYAVYFIFVCETALQISISSMVLGMINIMPLESFDGGQLLKIVLNNYVGEKRACLVTNILNIIAIFPLVFLGVTVLFITRYNFSVLFIALYLISVYITKEMR